MTRERTRATWRSAAAQAGVLFGLLSILSTGARVAAQGESPENPYSAEGDIQDRSRNASLRELREWVAALAPTARSAVDFCRVAELYKRLGDAKASVYYQKAIAADPDEPAYELLYGDYLRLYRGAGQQPLFPAAESHLQAASAKLSRRTTGGRKSPDWDLGTNERLRRSLTALYERDGFQLATRALGGRDTSTPVGSGPWLFFSPGARLARAMADLDRSSDIRDLTSAAQFSASPARLGRALTPAERSGLVHVVTPAEVGGTLRVRGGAAPVLDVSLSGRHSSQVQVTDFYRPNGFNDLELTSLGATIQKPFTIGGSLDALVAVEARRANRTGLIEFFPDAAERITQLSASGAASHYVGPDRASVSFAYARQQIDPEPDVLAGRNRELTGGTATYQIFRPLFGRSVNTGLGRRFQPRGIDLFAGALDDRERFPAQPADVVVTRRDYFLGMTARGLGRFDVTFQPTWFDSSVSNDVGQHNSQCRLAGTIVARILDEERTGGIPSQRFAGMRVAFLELVMPFHWDVPLDGLDAFRSRRLGAELWAKLFTSQRIGVTTLAVAGYARQQFPGVDKTVNLVSARISVGF